MMAVLTTNKMHTVRFRRLPMMPEGDAYASFITSWKTDNAGDSSSTQIQLPLIATGTYDFQVDWGDSNTDHITTWDQAETLHTYSSASTYTVTITGTIRGFSFNNIGDPLKLLTVDAWGTLELGNSSGHFHGCANLTSSALDRPIVGTTLESTFRGATLFNGDIGNWNVSAVTTIARLFEDAITFNQNLNAWNVSSVTLMNNTFLQASTFNQNIDSWDVSAVTDTSNMFFGATVFNGNIVSWDVSSVDNMNGMLAFTAFNQDIGSWNVSSVTRMNNMFSGNSVFNQDIGLWNVSSVTLMNSMFQDATSFNQDIGLWNVSSATLMASMFRGALAFNQDLSSWNTGAATDMGGMFRDATAFDQDIGSWDIADVTVMPNMFLNVTLSTTNYNSLLTGWEAQTVQNNVNFHGGNSTYNSGAPATARADLLADHMWTITDGGQV